MFNKRGQAALEFLSTYGWAFLVILVMIGALAYFGVLDPTQYVSDSCKGSGYVECGNGYAFLGNGDALENSTLLLDVMNNNQEAINITSIKGKEKSADVFTSVSNGFTYLEIPASDSQQLSASFGNLFEANEGSKKTYEFVLSYKKGSSDIANVAKFTITTDVQERS